MKLIIPSNIQKTKYLFYDCNLQIQKLIKVLYNILIKYKKHYFLILLIFLQSQNLKILQHVLKVRLKY